MINNLLEGVLSKVKGYGIKPHAIAIDCGGRQWDGVTLFCKNYKEFPVCAFAGRSSTQFQNVMYSRTRLKDCIGRTVLCGDEDERRKAGTGVKYCYFDSDWSKHQIHTAFNCVVGDVGSLSMYRATKEEHSEFVIQCTNERIKSIQHKPDGRDIYTWQSKEPHDYLDTCSMCRAALSQLGITNTTVFTKNSMIDKRRKIRRKYTIV